MTIVSISFILSCFLVFKSSIPIYIKAFTPFLLLSITIEFIASWIIKNGHSSILLYNFLSTFECCFYLWILSSIVRSKMLKKIIFKIIILYPVMVLADIYFIQQKGNFHSISYAFGCLLIIFFSIAYFYELFAKPQATRLSNEPAFWICSGLLFFYSVSFPLFVSANLIKSFPHILSNNMQIILIILNVFLYSLFSIAFLCKIQIRKS